MPQDNIVIKVDNKELNEKLSASMKLLGVHYDEYGRLVNAQGKYVGGLTQARIRMGDYINAQGKMCDAAGRVLDGLTASELKLRSYKDAEDNVRGALGDLIRISDQRIAKLDEEGKKAVDAAMANLKWHQDLLGSEDEYTKIVEKDTLKRIEAIEEESKKRVQITKLNEAFAKSLSTIGGAAGNLSQVAAIFGGKGGSIGKTAQGISIAAQKVQLFVGFTNSIKGVGSAIKAVTAATEGQTIAQTALNLVQGNWISLAAAGAVAAVALFRTGAKEKEAELEREKKHQESLRETNEKYADLIRTLKEYNTYIQGGNVEQSGFLKSFENQTAEIEKATRQLKIYETAYGIIKENQAKEGNSYWRWGDTSDKWDAYQEAGMKMSEKIDAQQKEVATQINALVNKDLVGATEFEKLKQRADYYTQVIDKGILEGDALANAQQALANNLQKQAEISAKEKGYGEFLKKEEVKIVQPQTQEELDAAIRKAAGDLGEGSETYKTVVENMRAGFEKEQKAREKADAEKRLADKFQAYADGSALWTAQEKAAHDLQAAIDTWTANFKDAGRSQAELDAAIVNLKQEYKDKQLQEYLSANDLKIKETEKLDAEAQYTETLKKIREAEETYGLQAAEAEKLRAQATEELADARMKKAEEEQQQRESRLNELGITGLREQMKSPFEKMMEQQMKILQAQAEGLISAAESNQLQAKLTADYWQQNAQQTESGERETGFEREEYKAASSLTAGSNELYQAMTQRESSTERYQTGVTKNLGNMARYSEENYETLQAIQANLASVMQTLGVV